MNGDDQNQGGQPQADDIGGGSVPEPTPEPTTDVPVQAPQGEEDVSTSSEPTAEVPPPPPVDTGGTPDSDESPS
ncbi:hypothetical protein A3A49_01195 [Candidatus Curtissbacteria bacterium RIFCSPLOWO2_01_FULL_38_11b]|uniref:Uncharacterized protein n=1 Tax=Candidatus Curtissbacteria bacterium RIFCSPLOWO2_01_FULL_38_11b TaxID=1797725 RepID=A0A1F5GZK4_9BACT|nr:MAG: hypothetical protein A3A49_01195 [Candidatus Curtissbacteria bacterium RIFCSPLOWO2_01_FULL_38_11b]